MAGGRPRGFSKDEALESALELFWRHGYEGTSLADLTAAMGVSRPSLYAAFGDKEALFRTVLDRYLAEHASYVERALDRPCIDDAIRSLLLDAATAFTAPDHPAGCLLVHGALAGGVEIGTARDLLAAARLARQAAILARVERAAGEGDLPSDVDPVAIAGYVTTLLHGMAVQALGGADRTALTEVAELALQSLRLDLPGTGIAKKRGRGLARPSSSLPEPSRAKGQLAMDL